MTVPQKNDAGGAGSVGTATDYARFLQMMINGGQLDGVRLLSPTTVEVHDGRPSRAGLQGLGRDDAAGGNRLRTRLRREEGDRPLRGHRQCRRILTGRAPRGTGFYVDPKADIICVWMTQGQPGMARRYDRYLFKQMVYQAIVD